MVESFFHIDPLGQGWVILNLAGAIVVVAA